MMAKGKKDRKQILQLAFAGWIPDPDPDEVTSDDWYTPPELCEELRDWLEEIDLDPCAAKHGGFVDARVSYHDNGLSRPWVGRVQGVDIRTRFVNPPYSHPGPWLKEIADLHNAYSPEAAGFSVALVRIDTSVWWWQLAWEADAICWLRTRVPFVRPGSTTRSQPRDHHALLFWGGDGAAIRDRWEWLGHVQLRQCPECEIRREEDAARKRTHERSGSHGHQIVAIDGIPIENYPADGSGAPPVKTPDWIPASEVLSWTSDPDADTAVIAVEDEPPYCRFCATRLEPNPTHPGEMWCPDPDCDSLDGRTIRS